MPINRFTYSLESDTWCTRFVKSGRLLVARLLFLCETTMQKNHAQVKIRWIAVFAQRAGNP